MEESKDAQNTPPEVTDGDTGPSSTAQDHVGDEMAQSIDADTDSKQHHNKQNSVDSYNSISSSSSSSSVDFKEANSGGETLDADATQRGETTRDEKERESQEIQSQDHTSLEKRLSGVSLSSETSQIKMESLDNATSNGNASIDGEASSGDVQNATVGRNSTASSSSRRVSVQLPAEPSSPAAVANGSVSSARRDSLSSEQLSQNGIHLNTDSSEMDERSRTSMINDTDGSAMHIVSTSDSSRPTSEALTPAPVASTSTDSKHLSANNAIASTEMNISPTRQSTASSTHNYDLIQQRAEHHHQDLEEHPKRHRRTLRGSEDLRANFEKLREELGGSASPAPPVRDSPTHENQTVGKENSGAPSQSIDANGIDWDFWGEVMNDYEGIAKTRPRDLSKAIQNGIPSALRGMMWQLMSASKDIELEKTYSELIRLPSIHEKAILRDLNRTFPNHEFFNDKAGLGQNNLLNIMKAYSLFDDEVGYCQGMAFVVGPLLLNMPDEEAFCVLVRLMKSYDLRSQYIPDMPGLQLRLYQFDRLLEELLPAVFMHLLRQGIKSSMYASQWFLTLLAYRFPLELVCCVFDLIFAEGVEAIFRFALAVMKKNEDRIVQLEFEQVLEFLKTGLFEEYKHQLEEGTISSPEAPTYSARTFVKEALQVKITPMMLDQYTSEWTEMCKQQNAQSVEVEQLRAINKKLSNQVRHLESSLAQINQEHCELVKQVVATRLEKEELEDELVRVKMALAQESLLREEGRGSIASRGSYASLGSAPMSPYDERRDSQLSMPK